jgi:hypothetical protein
LLLLGQQLAFEALVLLLLVPQDQFQLKNGTDLFDPTFFLLLQLHFDAVAALAGPLASADTVTQHGAGKHLDSDVDSDPNVE